MRQRKRIRRRALRAAKAVTMGAALVGLGVGCSTGDGQPNPDVGDDTNQVDNGTDSNITDSGTDTTTADVGTDVATTDSGADTGIEDQGSDTTEEDATEADALDTSTKMDVGDDAIADVGLDSVTADVVLDEGSTDTGEIGCEDKADDICPEICTKDDDADCCFEYGGNGPPCDWVPELGCMCAVPGPFVAPAMVA